MTPFLFTVVATQCLLATSDDDAISIHAMSSPADIEVHWHLDRASAEILRQPDVHVATVLSLSVVHDDGTLGFPVFATHQWRGDRLVLIPRYRLTSGATYIAEARLADEAFVEKTYHVPESLPGIAPRVRSVFPSSATLPANNLKFYVHFSQPMRQGRDIFEQIHLLDEAGKIVPDPWRRTELWNAEGDRLTLWIHPGRIKQGLNLRSEFGPVLKPRRRYQLVITKQVRNLSGLALEQTHVKEFMTSEEDHTRPDPSRWKLSDVRTGTRSPLVVKLDEPLDGALLMRLVTVVSEDSEIAGSINLAGEECVWTFIPTHPWPDGHLELRVNERLEDLAGNTPARVFDTDLTVPTVTPPVLRFPIKNLNGR